MKPEAAQETSVSDPRRLLLPKDPSSSCLPQWTSKITVEPVMFLYMFAFMLTSVVESAFFVDKACRVDLQYNDTICSNLPEHEEENKRAQVVVSTFMQYNNFASHAIPITLSLFLGAWSDRRGRKVLLVLGLVGKLYYSSMVVVNALQPSWTLYAVLWTATLPSTLTGADLAIFAAIFTYVIDITSVEERTMRVTVVDIVFLASMPSGVGLGKYLFSQVANRSFAIMFAINASLLALAVLYAVLRLQRFTKPTQRSMRSDHANWCSDFFDRDHVVGTIRTLVRKRPGYRRLYLIILIFAMTLYTFQRDEKPMSFLYTTLKFQWTPDEYSDWRTFQSLGYVVGTLIGLPLMSKLFGLSETVIVMVGSTAHAAARAIFALAEVGWLFYLGAAIASVGPVSSPVIRSMTSKIVPLSERGKVFALFSCADNALSLVSVVTYSQVYNATIGTAPNSIFWFTCGSQVAVFLLITVIHVTLGDHPLAIDEDEDDPRLEKSREHA